MRAVTSVPHAAWSASRWLRSWRCGFAGACWSVRGWGGSAFGAPKSSTTDGPVDHRSSWTGYLRVARGNLIPGPHRTERDSLPSLRSSHLDKANVCTHRQCVKRPGARWSSPVHHFISFLWGRSRLHLQAVRRNRQELMRCRKRYRCDRATAGENTTRTRPSRDQACRGRNVYLRNVNEVCSYDWLGTSPPPRRWRTQVRPSEQCSWNKCFEQGNACWHPVVAEQLTERSPRGSCRSVMRRSSGSGRSLFDSSLFRR
jgi:hypothetical protein